jgi:hypothetical protein
VGVLAASEFTEHEDPLPGVPSEEQMEEDYGPAAWGHYAARACQSLQRGRQRRGLALAGDSQEFIRLEQPTPSLPNLCDDYDLPALGSDRPPGQTEGGDSLRVGRP